MAKREYIKHYAIHETPGKERTSPAKNKSTPSPQKARTSRKYIPHYATHDISVLTLKALLARHQKEYLAEFGLFLEEGLDLTEEQDFELPEHAQKRTEKELEDEHSD